MAIDSGSAVNGPSLSNLLAEAMHEIARVEASRNMLPNLLLFGCKGLGLLKGDRKAVVNAGDINIELFENSYSLVYTGAPSSIEKLYDQTITEEGIASIVDTLGTNLCDGLETVLDMK